MANSVCTCHTEGCGNEGVPVVIETSGVDFEGNPYSVDLVICGACGNEIEDKVPEGGEGS